MATFCSWEDYNSRYISWDKITKELIEYLKQIQEIREFTVVEREVRDGIPYLKLSIHTYYKNKSHTSETRLTMSMLEFLDQNDSKNIIEKFVITFRKKYQESPVIESVNKNAGSERRKRHTTLETDCVGGVV